MIQVCVVTDSGATLPAGLASKQGIVVVPLVVRFGEQVYLDGQLSPGEFRDRAAAGPRPPATLQPAVGAFEEAFVPLASARDAVLCLTITYFGCKLGKPANRYPSHCERQETSE